MGINSDMSGTITESLAGHDVPIRCVTIRQLLEATQTHSTSPFKIDGNEFSKIIIVANLCYLDVRPTFTDFGLDDGTGRIKARQWDHNLDSPDDVFEVHDFPYLRVVGDLDQYKGKKTIKVMNIRKVSSPYEPYYHVLHTVCDTLVYECGPPSYPGDHQDMPSDVRNDGAKEPGALDHDAPVSAVHPPSGTAKNDTHSDLVTQSAGTKAHKGKARISDHKSPTPFSSSAPLAISQIRYHGGHGEDMGTPGYSGAAQRNDRGSPIGTSNQYKDLASEVSYGSSPPLLTPARQHTRRLTSNDPYSGLTLLQRDVLLSIETAAAQNPMPSLYPNSEHNPTWKGVHISSIVESVMDRRPRLALSLPEFTDCIEGLLEKEYIYNPIDEEHYSCR